MTTTDTRQRFLDLHADGIFVMPNPWDAGSARLLASLGFPALATTSFGHAISVGRRDQQVTLDQLVERTAAIAGAVDRPINVDAEYCFAAETSGIADTVERLAGTGAAGFSIEDFNPYARQIDPIETAIERVDAAARAAEHHGLVLTARAENVLYGVDDLDDTIRRLVRYHDAGAQVVYAPGLRKLPDIGRVVDEVGVPVNVLAVRNGPSVADLASVGVRRVSTGGALARAAYGELMRAARELLADGTSTYLSGALDSADIDAAFS